MTKFMRDGVMDSCTVREDVSRSVGLNGGAGSLVESRQDLYMFIVDLTLGKVCCIFEYSTFLLNTLSDKTVRPTNPPSKNSRFG